MLNTLFGIVIDVNPLHLKNTFSPMLITLFGTVIDIRLLQPQNA